MPGISPSFDPSEEKFKKKEDLPEEKRDEFVETEDGGFVKKTAHEEIAEAKLKSIIQDDPSILEERLGELKKEAKQEDKDRNEVLQQIRDGETSLSDEPEQIRADREVVMEAVQHDGTELAYASEDFRDDEEIVREAIQNTGKALQYASERLKQDKDIVLKAVKDNGFALWNAAEKLQQDKEVVLAAISSGKISDLFIFFDNLPEKLCKDREVVMAAVKLKGYSEAIPKKFIDDREIILEAIKTDGEWLVAAFEHEAEIEEENKQLAANRSVRPQIKALKNFMDDDEIVLEGIKDNAETLKYAHRSLKNDYSFLLRAYEANPEVIEFFPEDVKKNLGVKKKF